MSTTKFYSESFALENQRAHQIYPDYGSVSGYVFYLGKEMLPLLSMIKNLKPDTVLDYGCGKGLGADNISINYPMVSVTKYDPFVNEFSVEPHGLFDMVICYNVLQIVEDQYLKQVVDHCYSLTKKHLLLNILVNKKSTRDIDWWSQQLSLYPVLTKGHSDHKPSHDRQGEILQSANVSFWIKK